MTHLPLALLLSLRSAAADVGPPPWDEPCTVARAQREGEVCRTCIVPGCFALEDAGWELRCRPAGPDLVQVRCHAAPPLPPAPPAPPPPPPAAPPDEDEDEPARCDTPATGGGLLGGALALAALRRRRR